MSAEAHTAGSVDPTLLLLHFYSQSYKELTFQFYFRSVGAARPKRSANILCTIVVCPCIQICCVLFVCVNLLQKMIRINSSSHNTAFQTLFWRYRLMSAEKGEEVMIPESNPLDEIEIVTMGKQ